MSLLDDVSIVVTPNGYKAGELYAVIPVPTEGAELVTNGDFATDSDWTLDSSTSIAGGLLTQNGTAGRAFQSITFLESAIGTYLKITFTVEAISSGSFQINCYGVLSPVVTTTGTYTFTGVTSDTTNLYVNNGGGFANGSISNISVKTFLSADMDVTRATAATRVDENGLVNYAEIVGGEEVTNGDFSNGLNNWTVEGAASYASIVNGALNSNNTNAGNWYAEHIEQDISFVNGTTYKVTFKAKNISGNLNLRITQNATVISTENLTDSFVEYSVLYTANLTGGSIRLFCNGAVGQFEVDDISVKEVTRDNVPRIDYTGGGCPHILAEPQRTNTLTYSEDLNQASTVVVNSTVLLNQGISPNGDNSANKFTADTVFPNARLAVTTVINEKYTTSIYAKYEGYQFILLNFTTNFNNGSSGAWFDIINGTIGTTQSDVTFTKIEQLSNNWYRISITSEATSSGTGQVRIHLCDTDGNSTIAGATGLSNYVWGFQVETGSYPTSLIPTSGSTVTRNQDIFTRDGIGSLINSTEGVLFLEMAALANDGTFRIISLTDGGTTNRVSLIYNTVSNSIRVMVVSTSTVFDTSNSVTSTLDFHKIAIKWKLNNFAVWIDGVEVATDTSGNAPVGLDRIVFDVGNDTLDFFGKVKQLQVYKTALTDTQLAALTS